ncbi:GNAT family N-acetyltransferase [Emticicia sp. 21SJ11W-3]|uniref:GNAT family N-acetyltransferase n=1 Tax=Emticicia sp. 21SJ11W-3 TaxID=2916755 RepID=UPI0020A0216E|nr:GNAT family N-acetyltransferase [Emticicia sp. 21SJ11W-3]UTA67942.1 GNAT family N-acetyltransferase [Emticicia sp. 21SJ11W-3]
MNTGANVTIRVGTIAECIAISKQIPEFMQGNYEEKTYEERLFNTRFLILVALANQTPVGFKVGYQRDNDGSFYTWLGGVLPAYRKLQIAQKLADQQEAWAKEQGFNAIVLKTRNRFRPMLTFALKNGYCIEMVEPKAEIEDYRIILRKKLVT